MNRARIFGFIVLLLTAVKAGAQAPSGTSLRINGGPALIYPTYCSSQPVTVSTHNAEGDTFRVTSDVTVSLSGSH